MACLWNISKVTKRNLDMKYYKKTRRPNKDLFYQIQGVNDKYDNSISHCVRAWINKDEGIQ